MSLKSLLGQQWLGFDDWSRTCRGLICDRFQFGLGCARLSWSSDGGFTDKDGTCFDREGFGFDVTHHLGAGFQLDALDDGEVAVNFSVDDDGTCFDLSLDSGVFTDGEVSGRLDVTIDLAVDDQVVLELDGSLDFYIG